MTPVELTEGAGVVVALIGLALQAGAKRRADRRQALRDAEDAGEDNLASWKGFNESITAERNRLLSEAKEAQAAHRSEMQRIHDRHHEEITSMRAQWDATARETRETHEREISVLTRDLATCREEVSRLHAVVFRLQNPEAQR